MCRDNAGVTSCDGIFATPCALQFLQHTLAETFRDLHKKYFYSEKITFI